jgi:uncharacterized damage-inducible protein DinB
MTPDDLRTLYGYDAWAHARTFAALRALPSGVLDAVAPSSFPTIRATLAHMVSAEWIWLQRWLGANPTAPPPWHTGSLDELEAALAEVSATRDAFLATLTESDLVRPCTYRTLAGAEFTNALGGLMQHVVNHGSYHRGQLATQMRQLGHTPPTLDLLLYLREQER